MELVEHGHGTHVHGHTMSAAQKNHLLKFGWWVYIASEVMLFSSLLGTFVLAKRLHPEGGEHLNVPITTFNTFLLLMSSWTVVRALAAVHEGDPKSLSRFLFLSLSLGTIFVAIQGYEYIKLSHEGLTLHGDMYGSAFYVLTGFHGAHVAIGVGWLIWAFFKSLNGYFTPEHYIGIEILGLYWHFVDVVWIFLFPIIYLL
jgi:cytochrome c oxidase subunit 3/cytochrome o ubiquinol oxidase subunit 3